MKAFDKVALALVIIGAINWLLVGLFQFDIVGGIFGSMAALVSRIVYVLIGLAGLWCIGLLVRRWERVDALEPRHITR